MTLKPGVSLYGGFFQLAYVTTDIEQADWTFQKEYGTAKLVIIDSEMLPINPGAPARIQSKFGFAQVGDTQIEVIQPVFDETSFYRDILPKDGFGIRHHHVGFNIKDLDTWRAFRASVGNDDHPVAIEGDSEAVKWIYVNERPRLGHYLEYVLMGPELRDFFASIPKT